MPSLKRSHVTQLKVYGGINCNGTKPQIGLMKDNKQISKRVQSFK